ncbi:PAC2 family-domain-containing protein [Gautieria morchelliformis]|nr:PAC2 family-domain-containing protein [Gautieria morchelliformis]
MNDPNFSASTLSTKTLVVPIVSAANVSQLAADILIASLSLSRLGTCDARYHVPVVGGQEGGQVGVTTPLELFGRDEVEFVVMQQRSPEQKDNFISSLIDFAKHVDFRSVLFVSGVNPTNRADSQMHTPIFHLSSPAFHQIPGSPLALLPSLPQYNSSQKSVKGPSLPGGGLTRRVLLSIPENWSINTGFLVWMGMEGDNRDDAALVAGVIAKILSTDGQIKEWKEPESWRQGLFGSSNDHTLFG